MRKIYPLLLALLVLSGSVSSSGSNTKTVIVNSLEKRGKAQPEETIPRLEEALPTAHRSSLRVPAEVKQLNKQALRKTTKKLKGGKSVTIVFWGDSITSGAGASATENRFSDLVVDGLRRKYPTAQVVAFNAGKGGTSTTTRLAGFDKDVLSHNPDLVVIEFINDIFLKEKVMTKNYNDLAARLKQSGADVLMVNPSLPSPSFFHQTDWKSVTLVPYYKFVRSFAQSNGFALADVERRWEQLDKEGLKPDVLLVDSLIHPKDLGHRIYANEILKCF